MRYAIFARAMIIRKRLRLDHAIRYSWKNIAYSSSCWALAYFTTHHPALTPLNIPNIVVGILGTALAIILAFKNSSAYDRWWEARKIWGGVVNESRTLLRQLQCYVEGEDPTEELRILGRAHIAWVNALKLQLRQITDPARWKAEVYHYLRPELHAKVAASSNKVTRIGHEQGNAVKALYSAASMEPHFLVQLDDTLTRLTSLQGAAERIRNTPLPRPYDYYTLAFLNIFILFFPLGLIKDLDENMQFVLLPITIIASWIFFQIYIFGRVLSQPFQNYKTDVPLDAICRTIEIDVKEVLNESVIPEPLAPVKGVIM